MMHELMGLGHSWAFLYFFTYLILAQFIMLNLVVAVLLINYGTHMAMHVAFRIPQSTCTARAATVCPTIAYLFIYL